MFHDLPVANGLKGNPVSGESVAQEVFRFGDQAAREHLIHSKFNARVKIIRLAG